MTLDQYRWWPSLFKRLVPGIPSDDFPSWNPFQYPISTYASNGTHHLLTKSWQVPAGTPPSSIFWFTGWHPWLDGTTLDKRFDLPSAHLIAHLNEDGNRYMPQTSFRKRTCNTHCSWPFSSGCHQQETYKWTPACIWSLYFSSTITDVVTTQFNSRAPRTIPMLGGDVLVRPTYRNVELRLSPVCVSLHITLMGDLTGANSSGRSRDAVANTIEEA
jgi:hypothetical protein